MVMMRKIQRKTEADLDGWTAKRSVKLIRLRKMESQEVQVIERPSD
jgi:hypothetical protein